jgi:hypothetical protein
MDPANNKSHLQLPFAPQHTPQKSNPHPQKRMAGASYMHAHQKKKMGDQTEKNL